jgi:3-hydroxyacyl-CoA dehydrogenase/enoyl-CoA hydratase/3-hydroxybutyryl-CoA epimerase
MQLVEIVRAAGTSDATLARLVEFTRRSGKVPVVVRDSPGFLVNRVLLPYLGEALRMVCEGVSPEKIDREIRRFGNPMGPLELLDTIGLDVAADVTRSLSLFVDNPLPAVDLLNRMVAQGWLGKKTGRGFYHYKNGRRTRRARLETDESASRWQALVTAVTSRFAKRSADQPAFPIRERLVYLLINEAARCLGEGVVGQPGMVDLAMVLGTGFAPFRGGPLRLADELGLARVTQALAAMKQSLGERFAPCATLRQMSDAHREFYVAAAEPTSHSALGHPRKAE